MQRHIWGTFLFSLLVGAASSARAQRRLRDESEYAQHVAAGRTHVGERCALDLVRTA